MQSANWSRDTRSAATHRASRSSRTLSLKERTPDQATGIDDTKRDMEQPMPMDRLLCGDVGYGKTEVAMRAAFKAVMDGRQVAVLAPTTVLSYQHFQTFRSRFAAFPARIELLSRFRSPKEQKEVVEAVESGAGDIVVGADARGVRRG